MSALRVRGSGALAILASALAILLAATPTADAAVPPQLGQFPADDAKGPGANQIHTVFGLATDPNTGYVYAAEAANRRISVFDAWGVFVRAFGWGVEDGSPELQTCGPAEPEVSPPSSLCREGLSGPGAGQFDGLFEGIGVDSAGNVYVLERTNLRVQKFDAAGQFLLTFGGEVNKTTGGDVCTREDLEDEEVCGQGVQGTGSGYFESTPGHLADHLAIGADDTVYVGDKDRIQEFNPDGTFKGEIKLADLHAQDPAFPAAGGVKALAFDPSSDDLYFVLHDGFRPRPPVFRVDAVSGEAVDMVSMPGPVFGQEGMIEALAADTGGNLFVARENSVVELGPAGEVLVGPEAGFAAQPSADWDLPALATNGIGNLYVSAGISTPERAHIEVYGPPPIEYGPPPKADPAITEQFAVSAHTSGATLRARVNPRYWADTRYYVEYGTSPCFEGGCQPQPAPPGTIVTSQVVNALILGPAVFLSGLQPDTTYHYRFVAESGGGGPVKGISGKAGAEAEGTFRTMPLPRAQPPCPGNAAFRAGPGAFLPDCRAYEMVSPVDKEGADVSVLFNITGFPAGFDQSNPAGDALTYSAYRAFGQVEGAPFTSQYLARRGPGGWASEPVSPPRQGASLLSTPGLDSQYKGFSEDLCHGWLLQDTDNPLAEGWVQGFANVYRRDLCSGGYEALAPLKAPDVERALDFIPELQGFSVDGSKAFLLAEGKLTNNATTDPQLYEAADGTLRLVCIMPNKAAFKGPCTAGSGTAAVFFDRRTNLANAISADGSRIYWTDNTNGPGRLFVRVDRSETVQVGSSNLARFWTAADDGSRAIYSVDEELLQFELASKSTQPIAGGFKGVLGASEDATKVYFVSTEALAPGATAKAPNVYLYDAGAPGGFEFVATLATADLGGQLSPVAATPVQHIAQVSADGSAVAFMSKGAPTGYDNKDLASEEADAQVYLYRADSGLLACVSCNPTGARPTGRDIRVEAGLNGPYWASGLLPLPQNQVHAPRALSADGTRLFFESFDSLALRDTNGRRDVYQWEAPGTGGCEEAAPGFRASLGGCVDLISSGQSPEGSTIVDTSVDGGDVFFKTGESFVVQDPGLVDIYDARVDGGFPPPPTPPAQCEGEACQHPLGAPNDRTPASAGFSGPGNKVMAQQRKARKRARARKRAKARARRNKAKARGRRQARRDARHRR